MLAGMGRMAAWQRVIGLFAASLAILCLLEAVVITEATPADTVMGRILESWQSLRIVPVSPEWTAAASRLKNPFYFRNLTELVSVITNTAYYLSHLPQVVANLSMARVEYLEDYPDCGIRNNDTYDFLLNNGELNVNPTQRNISLFTAECLWDCRWQDNKYHGKVYNFTDPKNKSSTVSFYSIMPAVPVDLRCLANCSEVNVDKLEECLKTNSYLFCQLQIRRTFKNQKNETSISNFSTKYDYFDLALESCALAVVETELYNGANCTSLGVRLRSADAGTLNATHVSFIDSDTGLTRVEGPGATPIFTLDNHIPIKNRNPWQCSLRMAGFEGVHRCGVTLLSAPPKKTIFVSAAHCNFLCKNSKEQVVPICCCRRDTDVSTCSESDFCGKNATLRLADPRDLQIVCNLRTQKLTPQGSPKWPPKITYLDVLEIRNHPDYLPEGFRDGIRSGGPVDGHDISVYIVDDSEFERRLNRDQIWPACLPRADERTHVRGNQGILTGWVEPIPPFYVAEGTTSLNNYEYSTLVAREAQMDGLPACSDPAWMKTSGTYYPASTLCYTVSGYAGKVSFGMSGSGLVRPFTASAASPGGDKTTTRYSWVGPLSFYRGSDYSVRVQFGNGYGLYHFSRNPAVFTDGRCYLEWIASQYNLYLPPGYTRPPSCDAPVGHKLSANNTNCQTRAFNDTDVLIQANERCNFSISGQEKCSLFSFTDAGAKPEATTNVFTCKTSNGKPRICANDCPGVDANAVVIGGEAVIASIVVGSVGQSLLGPLLGGGVVATGLGAGAIAMNRRGGNGCAVGQCRTSFVGPCCNPMTIRGRSVCPPTCRG